MGSGSALKTHRCSKSHQSGEYSRRNPTTAESARGAGDFCNAVEQRKDGSVLSLPLAKLLKLVEDQDTAVGKLARQRLQGSYLSGTARDLETLLAPGDQVSGGVTLVFAPAPALILIAIRKSASSRTLIRCCTMKPSTYERDLDFIG
jgi:hypothetical protein